MNTLTEMSLWLSESQLSGYDENCHNETWIVAGEILDKMRVPRFFLCYLGTSLNHDAGCELSSTFLSTNSFGQIISNQTLLFGATKVMELCTDLLIACSATQIHPLNGLDLTIRRFEDLTLTSTTLGIKQALSNIFFCPVIRLRAIGSPQFYDTIGFSYTPYLCSDLCRSFSCASFLSSAYHMSFT